MEYCSITPAAEIYKSAPVRQDIKDETITNLSTLLFLTAAVVVPVILYVLWSNTATMPAWLLQWNHITQQSANAGEHHKMLEFSMMLSGMLTVLIAYHHHKTEKNNGLLLFGACFAVTGFFEMGDVIIPLWLKMREIEYANVANGVESINQLIIAGILTLTAIVAYHSKGTKSLPAILALVLASIIYYGLP